MMVLTTFLEPEPDELFHKLEDDFPSMAWTACCDHPQKPSPLLTVIMTAASNQAAIDANSNHFVLDDCDKEALKTYLESQGIASNNQVMTDIDNTDISGIPELICDFCGSL